MITVNPSDIEGSYKYWSRKRQLQSVGVTWYGLVTWNGVKGALGCEDGLFYMYRHHLERLQMPTDAVIMAIASGPPDGRR